ncbi:MAG: type II toxin-antitoxin system VapC family toxin [Verrucomicrobia bacterium]|nr:type II toxin-antitoxin system VapC family toxin [Verrucomicrobiota bacterium]
MSYLIDTCVLSECTRKKPNPEVIAWLEQQEENSLYISVIVLGEIVRGVAKLKDSAKKRSIRAWLYTDLVNRFRGRVLPIDEVVALEWGRLSGKASARGIQISMADGLIGATALVHGLNIATRNVSDLSPTGAAVFNPWTDA